MNPCTSGISACAYQAQRFSIEHPMMHVPSGPRVHLSGTWRFFHQMALLGAAIGPVHLVLVCPIDHPDDPWFVASDELTDAQTLGEYSLRFDIEEAFLDEKSAGFQFQTSELSTPEALERLLLVVMMATPHLTSIGLDVVLAGTRSFRGYPLEQWFELSEDRLAMAAARVSTWMAGVCSFLV